MPKYYSNRSIDTINGMTAHQDNSGTIVVGLGEGELDTAPPAKFIVFVLLHSLAES